MDRREALKAGLCLLGGACIAGSRTLAADPAKGSRLPRIPQNLDVRDRTFEMKLAPVSKLSHLSRLNWLESMLYRLGRETTLSLWRQAFRVPDDGLTAEILSGDWEPYEDDGERLGRFDGMIESRFTKPVEGVSKTEARDLVMMDTGVRLPMETYPTLTVTKNVTTYNALHLRMDGIARLSASMRHHMGKEGELVAYDILRESRIAGARAEGQNKSAAELLQEWAGFATSKESNIFTAGQNVELIKATDTEVITHVKACEWARYFSERHPTVAYLVSCSTDDAFMRTMNDNLRMQRTSTIMEGDKVCDFRVYSV